MGSTTTAKPYPPGIHVPSLTWFDNDKTQSIAWSMHIFLHAEHKKPAFNARFHSLSERLLPPQIVSAASPLVLALASNRWWRTQETVVTDACYSAADAAPA